MPPAPTDHADLATAMRAVIDREEGHCTPTPGEHWCDQHHALWPPDQPICGHMDDLHRLADRLADAVERHG